MTRCLLLLLLTAGVGLAVDPKPPRPCGGEACSPDCSGLIGFSSKGLGKVHSSGLASYRTKLANPGGGFFIETGAYTAHCPGFYLVAFSGYPQSPSKLTLKKHSAHSSGWEDIVSTGTAGGSNQIILQLEIGDQIGVFYSGSPRDSSVSASFSAYKLTQK